MISHKSLKKYFYHLFVMVRKDFLLEVRSKDVVLPVFVFSFLVVVTFNFALQSTPNTANLVVPGILWVSVLFGAMVGFGRMFLSESEQGAYQGLLAAPIGRDVIFFGKVKNKNLNCYRFQEFLTHYQSL